jgi:hypothetical protein
MSEEPESAPGDDGATRLLTGLVIVLGGLAAAGVFWWSTSSHTKPPDPLEWTPPTAVRVEPGRTGRYVGATSCRECHPGESAAFARSGHARTLRPAESDPIARWLDGRTVADPERAGVDWSYHLRDGKLSVDRREGGKTETLPIEFSFGSGQVGTTFVTTTKAGPDSMPTGIEHRLSYMAVGRKLAITPGQQKDDSPSPLGMRITPHGRLLDEFRLLRCFSCHVTTGSDQGSGRLDTATMIRNVTCERCHGPAGAHVEAARRGGTEEELRLPMGPDRDPPSAQLAACGECHRSPDEADMASIREDDLSIVRFQPIGLAKSKCFQGGASGLRCTSCHDPHARASRDTAAYEAVCLDCHRSGGQAKAPCPVSPDKGCVACHMPRRQVTPEFLFTDHWIRVQSKDPGAAQGPRAAIR